MHREEILNFAKKLTLGDRDKQYGDPNTNLTATARLFTAYLIAKYRGQTLEETQFDLSAEDVAWLNILIKMSRSFFGEFKADSFIDAAAYAAIAGEVAAIARDLDVPQKDFTTEQIAAMMLAQESRT
jgi:hypothetical protein